MTAKVDFPPTIRIGILVYDGFEPIDVWGFTEAFAISRFIGTDYQSPPPTLIRSNLSLPQALCYRLLRSLVAFIFGI
jgi:hypothetical protein